MTLFADGAGYKGTLTTDQGNNVLPVRSLTVQGSALNKGKVTYYNGQEFPMSGRRR
jgi:hypothetical protein